MAKTWTPVDKEQFLTIMRSLMASPFKHQNEFQYWGSAAHSAYGRKNKYTLEYYVLQEYAPKAEADKNYLPRIYYVYKELGTGSYMIDLGYYDNPYTSLIGKADTYEGAKQLIEKDKDWIYKRYAASTVN